MTIRSKQFEGTVQINNQGVVTWIMAEKPNITLKEESTIIQEAIDAQIKKDFEGIKALFGGKTLQTFKWVITLNPSEVELMPVD